MFDALSERLGKAIHSLRGRGRVTESNVRDAMREIRTALLEADVHVDVARDFCDTCVEPAFGQRVIEMPRPGPAASGSFGVETFRRPDNVPNDPKAVCFRIHVHRLSRQALFRGNCRRPSRQRTGRYRRH